ncbi:hypothetical protein [Amycolatopsis echigonensis]|uniref:Uncharacterized protein n=1 Tax=Amycolatopsis echigonensis TaxID=2576905 RepID=A0A8E1W7I0_9PSEU|nr:hypothetical protein [Amycolatopsis echigonensis]MBB2505251.1 hypothetical protein [Amycolatopsis echigonensis]
MTAVLDSTATLADCTLASLPLRDAVTVHGIEHNDMPIVVEHRLPGVEVEARPISDDGTRREYWFTDPASNSRLRLVVTFDRASGDVRMAVAETGPRDIFDELVVAFARWNQLGRLHPALWDVS